MLELSFLVDIIGKFTQPRSFSYHGVLNKSDCQQYCNGALPLPSDVPLIIEVQGFEDLENYSIHIRGNELKPF